MENENAVNNHETHKLKCSAACADAMPVSVLMGTHTKTLALVSLVGLVITAVQEISADCSIEE